MSKGGLNVGEARFGRWVMGTPCTSFQGVDLQAQAGILDCYAASLYAAWVHRKPA